MPDAILLKSVNKTFGTTKAVTGLDLAIPRGALYGFIGPNGAGKTTTIRMIMAILFPDSGELTVLGHRSALEAKSRIGYLPEERGVYRKMRVGPFLTFMARLKGVPEADIQGRVTRGLARVGLADTERKRCEELSKGTQQKIQFIATIIHEPDLLILDEPFSGLDPVSSRVLREMVLEEHARGATILFSTHVMPHAEELCNHVVMINKGQKVLDEPVAGVNPSRIREIEVALQQLNQAGETFLIVEHNVEFITTLCHKVIVLDQGLKLAEGTAAEIHADSRVLEAYLGTTPEIAEEEMRASA